MRPIEYAKASIETMMRTYEASKLPPEGRFHYHQGVFLSGVYKTYELCKEEKYAQYGAEFNRPEYFDEVIFQALTMQKHTRDAKTGLMYHAWSYDKKAEWADPETGCSPEFWGRAMGWVPVALLDELDFIPLEHAGRKELEKMAINLLKSLVAFQSEEGRWYQVVDKGADAGNWLENSCSCLYVAALCKAVRKGLLDREYLEYARKGYEAVINSLTWQGEDLLVGDVCIGTGVGDYDHYIHRPVSTNDLHGVGAFLLMCEEMEQVMAFAMDALPVAQSLSITKIS